MNSLALTLQQQIWAVVVELMEGLNLNDKSTEWTFFV